MDLFKAVWEIIKGDLMAVMKEFEITGRLDWRLNCTKTVLIPKCDGATSMHNFRPISLIGGIYKIISKTLTERLKVVMPSLISEFQGAFVDNMQITDDILIALELIDAREKTNVFGLVVKVNLEKAFDNISWSCLDYTVSRFGFGMVWRNLVKWCLSTARFSMTINGSASAMFRSGKGIKQGDPISHFLFIMIVEVLSVMIKKAADMDLIVGFKPSENAFSITHIQFADDLIVFLDGDVEQIQNLKNILLAFELISGLKVNFKKSVVAAVGNVLNTAECALLFGCPMISFPMKYLGIPLGNKSKAVGVWDTILQKFQKKLSIWQRRYYPREVG